MALMETFDENGWAPEQPGRPPTYARLGLTAAMLREEILELSLTSLPDNAAMIAEDIVRRSHQAYNFDLPHHARYDRSYWKSKSTADCIVLMMCYLNHVYNDFLLQRFLVSRLRRPATVLLRLARQTVSDVLELVNRHDQLNLFRVDLDWIVSDFPIMSNNLLTRLDSFPSMRYHVQVCWPWNYCGRQRPVPRSRIFQGLRSSRICQYWYLALGGPRRSKTAIITFVNKPVNSCPEFWTMCFRPVRQTRPDQRMSRTK